MTQRIDLEILHAPATHSTRPVFDFISYFKKCCFLQHFATFTQQLIEISRVLPLEISTTEKFKISAFQRTSNQVRISFPRKVAHNTAERARNCLFESYFSYCHFHNHLENQKSLCHDVRKVVQFGSGFWGSPRLLPLHSFKSF